MTEPLTKEEVDELLERLGSTGLPDGQLEEIRGQVERLCTEYSTADPVPLARQTERLLAEIDQLVAGRIRLEERRQLDEQAGWLALLLAALAFDVGDAKTAEQARQVAVTFGQDLNSRSILGWAHETATWFHISRAEWADAIREADAGLAIIGAGEPTGVGIQLSLQRSEAFARQGDLARMNDSFALATRLLDNHSQPANPKNHFRFDHAKFELRQMRILLAVGEDDRADEIAKQLQADLLRPDGSSSHPMRASEVLASRGLIEARRGNIAAAVDLATQAIEIGRRSRISFQRITGPVTDELARSGHLADVQRFLQRRSELLEAPPATA